MAKIIETYYCSICKKIHTKEPGACSGSSMNGMTYSDAYAWILNNNKKDY